VRSVRSAVLAVAVVAAVGASTADAAAPRVILVSGPPLQRPIVISNWSENGAFFSAAAHSIGTRRPGLTARPSFRLSFFWGPGWNEYVDSGGSLRAICPCQTQYHGRFWPAYRTAPAVIDLGHGYYTGARLAPGKVLGILRRHGVPVHCFDRGCRARVP
jgi:hypothetical protein